MRKDWEYKKLGEVCEVVSGATPKTNNTDFWGNGYYWITPAEINESTIYVDKTERQITDKALAKTNLRLLPKGTVLLSSRAPIGKVAICGIDMYCNQGFKNCICSDKINNKYLYYFFINKNAYLNSLGRGATFKEISKSIVEKITIPLPPKPTQLAIVVELDKINELIQLKKQQLKDYDQLAQSIFYEMFGDPVENEKGWEVKKFKDVYKMKSGDALSAKQFITGDYPVYGGNGISGYHNAFNKDGIYIIIGRVGVYCGNTRIVNNKFWLTDNAFELMYDKSSNNELFICTLLNCLNLRQYANAAAQPVISNTTLKDILIPLPPLPLQQQFAARIEAIERQKQQVSETIKDLETLLASRMQYWFD